LSGGDALTAQRMDVATFVLAANCVVSRHDFDEPAINSLRGFTASCLVRSDGSAANPLFARTPMLK
jgi:hypothetical protein